jgi:hypothetical protein
VRAPLRTDAYNAAKAEQEAAAKGASEADARVQRVMAASVRERTLLVQAALRSLSHLRTHVMHTTTGIRLVQTLEEDEAEVRDDDLT